jgi:quercetin dioxygenase-like cupin family protein
VPSGRILTALHTSPYDHGVDFWRLDAEQVEPRSPRILHSEDDANRVILLALSAGERLAEHQVHEHALVFVLDGEVMIRAGDDEQRLAAQALVHFKPAERHEVEAVQDARLVLYLAPWPGPGHPSRPD